MAVVWMDGQGYRIVMSIYHVSHTRKKTRQLPVHMTKKICSALTDHACYSNKTECRIYVYGIYVLVH